MNQWPKFGAMPGAEGTLFRIWASRAHTMELVLEEAGGRSATLPMRHAGDGIFEVFIAGAGPGMRYRFQSDSAGPFPDPASRYQPNGVHGPSEIVSAADFPWTDHAWKPPALRDLSIYELHLGTFSPSGDFDGALERLPLLAQLGVTAIELMPVADFPGSRNWGYDGASIFAPARCYGRPDDLRRLVDRAHALGLAVLLDVVYNHLGPDGAYLAAFSPDVFSPRHRSPWSAGINLDDEGSTSVRGFFIDNAIYWLRDFHFDGLRLDATHALVDDSARHFLAELTGEVRKAVARPVLLVAEDHRNLAHMVLPEDRGGWGLDAVWSDDFHHHVRRLLAGDREGYYADYEGTTTEIAAAIRQGWTFCGQVSKHLGEPRGSDPSPIELPQCVVCIQNHDQVGNRALGERLNHQVDAASYRAASALLLFLPETPLLFMGQEWGASTPFLYFTDHEPELGRLVTQGRREEFRGFSSFSSPGAQAAIPDPQAPETFERSRLRWEERDQRSHAGLVRMHQELLRLRHGILSNAATDRSRILAEAPDTGSLIVVRPAGEDDAFALLVRLSGPGGFDLAALAGRIDDGKWEFGELLSTEDRRFAPDPLPPARPEPGLVRLRRPGAVLFRLTRIHASPSTGKVNP